MASRAVSPLPQIVASVIELLTERPQTYAELAAAMTAEGIRLGVDPTATLEDALEEAEALQSITTLVDDERLFWAPALLDGAVFTHRVTEFEHRYDLLIAEPDLLPPGILLPLSNSAANLIDGREVRSLIPGLDADFLHERGVPEDATDGEVWLLEAGWLADAGIRVADLVEVSVTNGKLGIRKCDTASFDASRTTCAQELVHRLATSNDRGDAHEIDVLIASAIDADPTSFAAPLPPLGELITGDGFTIQGSYLCPPGVHLREIRTRARVDQLSATFGIERDGAAAVLAFAGLVDTVQSLREALLGSSRDVMPDAHLQTMLGADATSGTTTAPGTSAGGPTVRQTLDRLATPEVAQAAATEVLGVDTESAAALELCAELLEPMVGWRVRPAMRWLRAKAQERDGRVLDAERTLEAAYGLDPQWPLVLLDLAHYASDRGDVERGLSLLRRAGVGPDDRLLNDLERHRGQDRTDIGRNDPCWCGSGKRYKACHRGRERLELAERANWLYTKAWMYLTDGPARIMLIDAAVAWAGRDDERALVDALGEDLVIDATLFEGGVFADFVAERGPLLPDDERLLAEQWLLVERSVHEVEEVRRDRGFTTRDIRTGDRHEVSERLATRQLKVGDLILVRLVPDGRDMVIFGGIALIDLARRDVLVALLDDDPDAVDIVTFIRAMHAPPTLINADGGELVICEARLRTRKPAELAAWLDTRLVASDDEGPRTWHEQVESRGGTSVRASVTLDGDELTLFSMNEDRFDALLTEMVSVDPTLEILEQTRQSMADIPNRAANAGPSTVIDPKEADPELKAVLHAYLRTFEEQWLDEQIPALGGVTPRQAADDPTRRDDLIRLLDSFPDTNDPAQMSARRLRAALGLD